ncbi:hypothetical protein Val02_65610 [Virgisporangium aliadipatigenens]|uniref:Flagellar basal body-associated protein FliL n=1 Tax=Virgisporangium aliadipatigenens TaxID=741659 RepID=A0A8J4DSW6_9ACTN|nr:hypothetical protein [Virgisporangium aliadipatigenens]GIJ49675.1 hypothetical protein Val02_65610 [Virgisporangium aliadipatigenens]
MSHPSSGQPYYGQPGQNQPQYGGYPGGPAPDPYGTNPSSGVPYSGGPAYPQSGGPSYPQSGPPGYPQESYTTEPPYSGQPYQGPYGPTQQQPVAPSYDQGYPQQPQAAYQVAQPYATPAPARSKNGLIALVASGGVLVLLIAAIASVALLRDDDEPVANGPGTAASAGASPEASPSKTGPAPEYPATISLPATVAGMTKVDDADLQKTADETATKIKNSTDADSAIAAYYAPDGDVQKIVGLVGATTRITDPESELDGAFSSALAVSGVRKVDAGPLGGVMKCGNTSSGGVALTVCGWADGGSLALGIFLNRSVTESGDLFVKIRAEILHRG